MPEDRKPKPVRRAARGRRGWESVEVHQYKQDQATPYEGVTRQVLFRDSRLKGELRYFEVAPGGYSTLERHEHMHAVLVLHGAGQCLVGDEVQKIGLHDLVTVPPWTWHQFRAAPDEPLGFLCLVDAERDRPQLPNESELEGLKASPAVRDFLGGR
ncbi:MAG TPA: cupin domain-containing protein [Roseiarcus sp.]|nr:cupin domain-containing protein [Roseiarcus sp.]